jgi:hypothetical protein
VLNLLNLVFFIKGFILKDLETILQELLRDHPGIF